MTQDCSDFVGCTRLVFTPGLAPRLGPAAIRVVIPRALLFEGHSRTWRDLPAVGTEVTPLLRTPAGVHQPSGLPLLSTTPRHDGPLRTPPAFTLIQKPEHPPSDEDNPEQAFDALHREARDAIGADTWRPRAHHPRSQYRNPRFLRTAALRSETEAPGDRDGGGQMIYDARSVGCLC
jgi:hypothetical protein